MECTNCGKSGIGNYCKYCGGKLVSEKVSVPTRNAREWFGDLFDLGRKKSFFEAIFLSGIVGLAFFLLNMSLVSVFPEIFSGDDSLYVHLWMYVSLVICYGLVVAKEKSLLGIPSFWVSLLVTATAVYWLGLVYGIWALAIVLMFDNRSEGLDLEMMIKRRYIYSEMIKGAVWWMIGGGASWIGIYASTGDTYTVWYGATLWGMFIVLRSLYYLFVPNALKLVSPTLDQNGDQVAQTTQELSDEERNRIKRKVNNDFKKYLLYGLLIFLGLIVLVVIFS